MHDYKNYSLLLKSFLCKKYGCCTICPAWHTKKKECCLLKISKTLRGKRKTITTSNGKRMEFGGIGMITYDTLKELAYALSKVIGFRYIAFDKIGYDLNINFSNEKMEWFSIEPAHRDKLETKGYWDEHSNYFVLSCRESPNIDWSKCQFDCKETYRGTDFYNGKPFEYHGTHNGVDYWIVSYGYHPLAYVKADQIESKTYFSEYECHGEITFKGKRILWTGEEDVIGWDYAHLGLNDYSVHMAVWDYEKTKHLKRWKFSEVEKEIFEFIDKYKLEKEE